MAAELATSQSTLERKNLQLEDRRRYIETILERIATGVVSIGADERIETINGAACRLLAVDRTVIGTPAERLFARDDLHPLRHAAAPGALGGRARGGPRDHPGPRRPGAAPGGGGDAAAGRGGRRLRGRAGVRRRDAADPHAEGGGVARRGAAAGARDQESADADSALRRAHAPAFRHGAGAGPCARRRVHRDDRRRRSNRSRDSSTSSRSSRGCRRRRPCPRICTRCSAEALALYNGLFRTIRIERRFDETLPPVRIDVEQIRRVAINLVDNAVEALGGVGAAARPDGSAPTIVVETQHDRPLGVARHRHRRQRSRHPGGRSRQAVHAVLLDQAARQRPRPGHRPPHHRRARRQHRSGEQRSHGHPLHRRAAVVRSAAA